MRFLIFYLFFPLREKIEKIVLNFICVQKKHKHKQQNKLFFLYQIINEAMASLNDKFEAISVFLLILYKMLLFICY